MKKRILVTGADGFTGRHFTCHAENSGYEIHKLKSNLLDLDGVTKEVLRIKPHLVVHLGAISAVTHSDESDLYQVNVIGSMNLLNALTMLSVVPEKVLLASSASVYGNSFKYPACEDDFPAPVNHYAMSKLSMEFLSKSYFDSFPIITVRPFNYTGVWHDERFIIPKLVSHFSNRKDAIELGNIDVMREFNDVRTVCDSYIKLLESSASNDVFNICSGNPISIRDVINELCEITGHSIKIQINKNLIRKNEIQILSGSPSKLEENIGNICHPPLSETLTLMLDSY